MRYSPITGPSSFGIAAWGPLRTPNGSRAEAGGGLGAILGAGRAGAGLGSDVIGWRGAGPPDAGRIPVGRTGRGANPSRGGFSVPQYGQATHA